MKTPSFVPAALALALLACATAVAAQELVATPVLPAYGESVAVEVRNADWPMYLPATRYSRNGSVIEIEYEYLTDGFGPSRPDFASVPLRLGELAPGNYQVRARLRNIERPSDPQVEATTTIAMRPPLEWGIYTMPRAPQAYSAIEAIVRSAAYFDPATLKASVSGNVVRVDFSYLSGGSDVATRPARFSTFGSVRIPDLAPGAYRVEGWGRALPGGETERFFVRDFVVASTVPVIEFHAASLGHYFMAAGSEEIDLLDRGGQGDWKRTGQSFSAWLRQADAPAGAVPVCRFYARGPNSHFYTGSIQECDYLRTLERQQRAASTAVGEPFLGWAYEAIAFWAMVPQAGQCGAGLRPVYRAYNDRAAEMDSNHRFMGDARQHEAMLFGWRDEGVQLCSAGS